MATTKVLSGQEYSVNRWQGHITRHEVNTVISCTGGRGQHVSMASEIWTDGGRWLATPNGLVAAGCGVYSIGGSGQGLPDAGRDHVCSVIGMS